MFRQAYYETFYDKNGDKSVTMKLFKYFYLGEDGKTYTSDYNDITENRGVMVDYPAYFGTTTSELKRSCVYNRVMQTTLEGKLETFIRAFWRFTREDELADEPPVDETVDEPTDEVVDYVTYPAAYPYYCGYACVTDEDGIMYFIDEEGKRTFESKSMYWSVGGRYVVDQFLLPLDETTALGCYYYEYGLVKARRQVYDYYQLETYKVNFIMSDEYVMLYEDGTEFPVPAGYEVLTYSNGVILLEKDGKYGYMDYTGAWLNSPDYEDAEYFMEGLAACKKNGK